MEPRNKLKPLGQAVENRPEKVLNRPSLRRYREIEAESPVLIILAAGKGTRFGQSPKCAQLVSRTPLARIPINAFRQFSASPVICIVGYRHIEVMEALGDDNVYVLSDNPTGGTAFAALEAFSISELSEQDPLLIITMGDRIVTSDVFRRLYETHVIGAKEADLTLLTAIYEPPKNLGKGRIVRDESDRVIQIVEQRDIDIIEDIKERYRFDTIAEGNCPLYAIRSSTLQKYLRTLRNDNAQGQYYLTDIVELLVADGADIRTITTAPSASEYDLLTSDVTRPADLALLEGIFAATSFSRSHDEVESAALRIMDKRPPGQVASIAAQLEELLSTAETEKLGFLPDRPVSLGISGGRVRVAFMHPDMGRFFGPAWQMPFGAKDRFGREQIVVLLQSSEDRKLHLFPTNPEFRERLNDLPDSESMYPTADISDWYSYEGFGTRMAEGLLLSLGYFTDEELQARRDRGLPLPPPGLWVGNSMRRPFSLVGNAVASMRTLRTGNLGTRVQTYLGPHGFSGLRVMSTGEIPQGGFSSSSAVTVATKNALNALFDFGIPAETLVHLACQAEYGTGVRAGALDQATEQKGVAGQGTLISSNPRENYRILGTYPVPAERFHILFAYSVERDLSAWEWSAGTFAAANEPQRLTAVQMRKMTGKTSELAAILSQLPLDQDFFQLVESDLLDNGRLGPDKLTEINRLLRQFPLTIRQRELREILSERRSWYIEQLLEYGDLKPSAASSKADSTFEALLSGWHDPTIERRTKDGDRISEVGLPMRAIMAYLFCEVAKNLYLIHHPEDWIKSVSSSQVGDRWFDIDYTNLPSKREIESSLFWEKPFEGPVLLDEWMRRFDALPVNYNRNLDDESLSLTKPRPLHRIRGSNFFRGLALIDLAEAMLKRAFGANAVAVRINAAGQGDYFQIHVDTETQEVESVKNFIEKAVYRRFGLRAEQPFFEPHPGGGAVGVKLSRFDNLADLIQLLRNKTVE